MIFRRIEDGKKVDIKNAAHATGYFTAIDNRGRNIWEVEKKYADKLAGLRDDDELLRLFAGRQYNTEITDESNIGMLCEKELIEAERVEEKARDAERTTRDKLEKDAERARIKAELLAEIEAEKAKPEEAEKAKPEEAEKAKLEEAGQSKKKTSKK